MKMNGARVYSYLRFSDPKQAAGHSADRQMEYARRWASAHALVLDETLSLRDEGLSAYHQHHVHKGALGAFLRAVDDGRIPPGSVLVVEGLDRLSRAEPILAQAQLAQIINAGITVVTASDGKEYNRAGLKAQPMDLVYSLLVMIRAHEESETKSRRVKAAIVKQCRDWQAGKYRGQIRNGTDPAWVRWTANGWEVIESRAEAVRFVVRKFREGHGAVSIIKMLHTAELRLTNGVTHATQLYKLIRLPALVGVKTLEIDGEAFSLADYYPCIISDAEYNELQVSADTRGRRKGKGEFPGILSGIGISHCGYCGTALMGQNLMSRRKPDGTMSPGHRRLSCVGYVQTKTCPVGGSVMVGMIEGAIMRYCADQMNLSGLMAADTRAHEQRAIVATAHRELGELEKQLDRVTVALMADTDAAPLAFIKKARELEKQIADKKQEIEKAERWLVAETTKDPAPAKAWEALIEGVEALDYEARLKARQLMLDTFKNVVLYHRGIGARERTGDIIDLLLVSKTGQVRTLRITRKTGDWIAMETLTPP